MPSASGRIAFTLARSANTIARIRFTAPSRSLFTTTYWYCTYSPTSDRATSSRVRICASVSLLRPRKRLSSTSADGGSTKIPTVSMPRLRTCRAPWTSITSITSSPAASAASVSCALVP